MNPSDVSSPVADESRPGGSYLQQASKPFKLSIGGNPAPDEPSPRTSSPSGRGDEDFARMMANYAKGDASDINDIGLTISGIADGDPVGMETFDLGFFDDGTPAIVINGANVPIRYEQWMTLMTQRQKTRAEVQARIKFESEKRNAKEGITKILASAPSVPPQLGQLLLTMADMDPVTAMQETQQLLVSMSKDNGRQQIGKLSMMLQDSGVASEIGRIQSEVEVPILDEKGKPMLDANLQPMVRKSTRARERVSQLSADRDPRKRKTAYAISNIDSMFPPKGMKADPSVNGKPIGIFDIMVGLDGGDTSELSRFELLRNLAAYSDLWPSKVDWVDTPIYSDFVPGRPTNPGEVDKFRNYLFELDQWASSALKWDRSDPRAIDMIVNRAVLGNKIVYNPNAQPAQQGSTNQGGANTAEDQFSIDFGS